MVNEYTFESTIKLMKWMLITLPNGELYGQAKHKGFRCIHNTTQSECVQWIDARCTNNKQYDLQCQYITHIVALTIAFCSLEASSRPWQSKWQMRNLICSKFIKIENSSRCKFIKFPKKQNFFSFHDKPDSWFNVLC